MFSTNLFASWVKLFPSCKLLECLLGCQSHRLCPFILISSHHRSEMNAPFSRCNNICSLACKKIKREKQFTSDQKCLFVWAGLAASVQATLLFGVHIRLLHIAALGAWLQRTWSKNTAQFCVTLCPSEREIYCSALPELVS